LGTLFEGYSYPYLVHAFDRKDKCGFTPQDWNITWVPDENYEFLSELEFTKIVSKEIKSCTTHFNIRKYKFRIDDLISVGRSSGVPFNPPIT